MRAVVFDSGSLITLAMNGMLYIIQELKKTFPGKFLITLEVKREVIDNPLKVKRFELEALQIQDLLEKKILELPEAIFISSSEVTEEANFLLDKANHFLQVSGNWIEIVSPGEMSCLALSSILSKKDIENVISIDERTTRLLAEKPENLEKMMSERLHKNVKLVANDYRIFSKYKFIRSTELIYVAFKKDIIPIKDKRILEAALYAAKFKGCSVSFEEIEELKKL